jgi:hypothetical protein
VGLQDSMQALKSTTVEELQEQADETGYLTPREFAKLRGVHAQQVYGWIRKGLFSSEKCKCGRTIVNVKEAVEALERRARELGRIIDTSTDEEREAQ